MRVTLLFEYRSLHGGERSMLAVLDALPDGVDVDAVAPGAGPLAEALGERGVDVTPLELAGGDGRRGTKAESVARLADVLRGRGGDVIHANSLSMGRLLGAARRGLSGHAAAMTGHVRDIVRLRRAESDDLGTLDRLAAVSEATRRGLTDGGVASSSVAVVRNGVDGTVFRPDPSRRAWLRGSLGLPDDAGVLLTVGQIALRKGQDVAAEAAVAVCRQAERSVFWVLAGARHSVKAESVAFDEGLAQRFASAGITDRLIRLGVRDDVPALMAGADVLLHTPRQEPFGRVLLEAAACGLPVVTTDVGGTREMFPGDEACVVPADDAAAVATATTAILRDPAASTGRAARARRRVLQAFTPARSAAELVAFWRAAVAG